jgi:hypothetical protein
MYRQAVAVFTRYIIYCVVQAGLKSPSSVALARAGVRVMVGTAMEM